MVVGTLNLGSEMGLEFKVPTTMRRHAVREVVGGGGGDLTL